MLTRTNIVQKNSLRRALLYSLRELDCACNILRICVTLVPPHCSLLRNPVVHKPSYRLYVIHKLPQLRVLDFKRIRQKVLDLHWLL